MRLLNRPEDPEAFNSNLASAWKRSKLPDWFPHPYHGYENLKIYVSHSNLKPKKAAQTFWTPPFEIFLCGDKPKTILARWKFLIMFRSEILDLLILSLRDPAVHPLTKKEWRAISSGAEFRFQWPKEKSFPAFDPTHYWCAGLIPLFGTEATTSAKEAARTLGDGARVILPDMLSCDCEVDVIDWEKDQKLKITLALLFAEVALLHEFALIDPDLTREYGEPPERTNLPLLGNLPDHLMNNSTFVERMALLCQVVWYGGQTELRGWERKDFDDRKNWVWHVSCYLEPLWRKHEHLKGEKMYLLHVDRVTPEIVASLEDGDSSALHKIEMSLLVFWLTALQRDFGILHTPFFSSPGVDLDRFTCLAHRQ